MKQCWVINRIEASLLHSFGWLMPYQEQDALKMEVVGFFKSNGGKIHLPNVSVNGYIYFISWEESLCVQLP